MVPRGLHRDGMNWSYDETVLALELMEDVGPSVDRSTPDVISLAARLSRTPSSVVRKVGNLRAVATGGKSGLPHNSETDRKVWAELGKNRALLASRAADAWVSVANATSTNPGAPPRGPSALLAERVGRGDFSAPDGLGNRKTRYLQDDFRDWLMELYDSRCALCEVTNPTLLVTSHIARWADDVSNRLNPANAILLCSLHDRAFEKHLFGIRRDLSVLLAPTIITQFPYEAKMLRGRGRLRLPMDHPPDPGFLRRHLQLVR